MRAGATQATAGTRTSAPRARGTWPGREHGLTAREAQVLALVTAGYGNGDIADALFLSTNSVRTHLRKAYRKIGVASRTQAVLWGVDHGLRVPADTVDDWVAA